jgi:hypothetical protein
LPFFLHISFLFFLSFVISLFIFILYSSFHCIYLFLILFPLLSSP